MLIITLSPMLDRIYGTVGRASVIVRRFDGCHIIHSINHLIGRLRKEEENDHLVWTVSFNYEFWYICLERYIISLSFVFMKGTKSKHSPIFSLHKKIIVVLKDIFFNMISLSCISVRYKSLLPFPYFYHYGHK